MITFLAIVAACSTTIRGQVQVTGHLEDRLAIIEIRNLSSYRLFLIDSETDCRAFSLNSHLLLSRPTEGAITGSYNVAIIQPDHSLIIRERLNADKAGVRFEYNLCPLWEDLAAIMRSSKPLPEAVAHMESRFGARAIPSFSLTLKQKGETTKLIDLPE